MSELTPEDAEKVAEAIPQFTEAVVGIRKSYAILGAAMTAAAGAITGYYVAWKRLETKYAQISAEEIAEMREHYQAKMVSLDNQKVKRDLESIVTDKGYGQSTEPPMAVTPPENVVEAAKEAAETEPKAPETRNVFTEPAVKPEEVGKPQVHPEWDAHKERSRRSPLRPYVIHRDERQEHEAYDEVTVTYYEEDDVLCHESDEVIDEADRERLIGEASLEQFGHGSGDSSIVYVRNDVLKCDFEVVRSPNSYAEEVHGFQHSDVDRRTHHERTSFDDE